MDLAPSVDPQRMLAQLKASQANPGDAFVMQFLQIENGCWKVISLL